MATRPWADDAGRISLAFGILQVIVSFFPVEHAWLWALSGLIFIIYGLVLIPRHPEEYYSAADMESARESVRREIFGDDPETSESQESVVQQIDYLYKSAIESQSPESLIDSLEFCSRLRNFGPFNGHVIHIQRPGAVVVGTPNEWLAIGRTVASDARAIIVYKPFGPYELVYDLEDTLPPIDRSEIGDPFSAVSKLSDQEIEKAIQTLIRSCLEEKRYRISIVLSTEGYYSAGTASFQGLLPIDLPIQFISDAHGHVTTEEAGDVQVNSGNRIKFIPYFRIKVNGRMTPPERLVTIAHELGHIFCGHQGNVCAFSGAQPLWPDRSTLGYHEKEMEAEAVAFLIAKRALIISGSAQYLKYHLACGNELLVDKDRVIRAAGRIERLAGLNYSKLN